MSRKNKRFAAILDKNQVTPLTELADELGKSHGWKKWMVKGSEIHFEPKDRPGLKCKIELTGFAFYKDGAGAWVESEEDDIIWGEEFDAWCNAVWAEDIDGNVVMLQE